MIGAIDAIEKLLELTCMLKIHNYEPSCHFAKFSVMDESKKLKGAEKRLAAARDSEDVGLGWRRTRC